jgi:hypothetical protein
MAETAANSASNERIAAYAFFLGAIVAAAGAFAASD